MDKIIISTVQVGEGFGFSFVCEELENDKIVRSKLATQNTEILTGPCQRQGCYPTTGKRQKQRITLRERIAMLTFGGQMGSLSFESICSDSDSFAL
jgi:hypothetical protein